ncbi:MAG: class I SAM-dependent methyltransferase [Acidobacteria bacterium]|nr:class I SAM-dependent methyltransferase [Acidobacteriota bacterium]
MATSDTTLAGVRARMREDWNARASEDAHYYVAFGRRNQSGEEFFDTAREQVRGLMLEMRRLPAARVRARRALEIGCGPGRLMKPLLAAFGEIHGVDISDQMIERARENLVGIPHAHAHHAPNSNLEAFADESFDFVYSYAVFQHIPSREVVMGYLDEAARVLKPGGVIRVQINGLPHTARVYDTWSGVRISAEEVRAWARAAGLQLLALEGVGTQYMWATFRKPLGQVAEGGAVRIRRVTNAHSSEPAAPVRGRFAALSLWVEGLPEEADLNGMEVRVCGAASTLTYLGPSEFDGIRQLNLLLPEGLATGLGPVELSMPGVGEPACALVRLISPGPPVPRVLSVTDGIDLLSGSRIVTGTVKAVLEEVEQPELLRASVGGCAVESLDHFCTDPRLPRYEVNFDVPAVVASGSASVRIELGERALGEFPVEVFR